MVRHEIKSPILNSESLIATRSDKQYMINRNLTSPVHLMPKAARLRHSEFEDCLYLF